jgi:hypothetical protein
MSRISREALSKGVFGAIAVTLTFGAVQLASGRDLTGAVGVSQIPAVSPQSIIPSTIQGINREAKADRAPRMTASAAQMQTISLRLDSLSDTSVLIRVPVAGEARNGSFAPSLMKSGGKVAVACEPVVSVLTEVAKRLEPGRCVT